MAAETEIPVEGKPVKGRPGPPTIADVARLAGTSEATVSRALRGSRPVGEELRLSVIEAAKALDYTPNRHAQALARSVDAAIGVVVHDSGDPYFVEILRGILGPAEQNDRMVVVCDTRRDPEQEFKYVRHFRTQRVQALLLAGSGFEDREFGAQMTSEISAFERSGARVALIGRHHILGDSVVLRGVIKDELSAVRAKFATPRRAEITFDPGDIGAEERLYKHVTTGRKAKFNWERV